MHNQDTAHFLLLCFISLFLVPGGRVFHSLQSWYSTSKERSAKGSTYISERLFSIAHPDHVRARTPEILFAQL